MKKDFPRLQLNLAVWQNTPLASNLWCVALFRLQRFVLVCSNHRLPSTVFPHYQNEISHIEVKQPLSLSSLSEWDFSYWGQTTMITFIIIRVRFLMLRSNIHYQSETSYRGQTIASQFPISTIRDYLIGDDYPDDYLKSSTATVQKSTMHSRPSSPLRLLQYFIMSDGVSTSNAALSQIQGDIAALWQCNTWKSWVWWVCFGIGYGFHWKTEASETHVHSANFQAIKTMRI